MIRLPVNMHSMTSGSPSFTLDPLYLSFLDSVVRWCEELELHILIDNHSFDPAVPTAPDIEEILIKVWSQTASHFKDRSSYILFEILNEPHGIKTTDWGAIQGRVIKAIREIDNKHTIVVGGAEWNSYNELKNLPVYSDPNLLYTFHFYDPFIFTHQGATWGSPSLGPLAGVPFPWDAARMPACPQSLKGTWIESQVNNYSNLGTAASVRQLIDNAISFRNSRNVNIFCGEFGVYIPNSNNSDRVYWYDIVKQYFELNYIPWTIWDYQGGFGLFNKGSDELFDHDLNVPLLQALGFEVPEQTPFSVSPDAEGFTIYSDYLGQGIMDASGSSGIIDFYSSGLPNNGLYCLSWENFRQYHALTFDFKPDRDLSLLMAEDYAIDFMVRGNLPEISFEVRFVDSQSAETDNKPWRMGIMTDKTMFSPDGKWHHIHIPFSRMKETGSWFNGAWHNPEGKFDWSAIDRLQFSIEHSNTLMQKIWLDNIVITNIDTAIVREYGALGMDEIRLQQSLQPRVSPNPATYQAAISYDLPDGGRTAISILTLTGKKIRELNNEIQSPGLQTVIWDLCDESGSPVPPGVYICIIAAPGHSGTCKIIKL